MRKERVDVTELTSDEKETMKKAVLVSSKLKVEEVAKRAGQVFNLDEHGTVYLKVPKTRLTDGQQIAVQLAGRRIANLVDLANRDSMTPSELAEATGIAVKAITARVSELRRRGWVEPKGRGEYRLVFGAIDEVLRDVEP